MMKCFECGAEIKKRKGEFTFNPPANIPGGPIIIQDAIWEECTGCGEKILPPLLLDSLDQIRYDRLGLLRSEEIKAIRQRAGLTQEEIAVKLGIGKKTYTRWENGRSLQNKSSDTLLRIFSRNPEMFEQLEKQRNPERERLLEEYIKSLEQNKGHGGSSQIAAHDAELNAIEREQLRLCLEQIVQNKKKEN